MAGYLCKTVCLPIQVYEGASGNLILMQEFPDINGEHYVRLFVDMDEAEKLCASIMQIAKAARSK